jgi:hypothetical protein
LLGKFTGVDIFDIRFCGRAGGVVKPPQPAEEICCERSTTNSMADDRELLEDARLEEEARLASEEFELLLAEDEALARSRSDADFMATSTELMSSVDTLLNESQRFVADSSMHAPLDGISASTELPDDGLQPPVLPRSNSDYVTTRALLAEAGADILNSVTAGTVASDEWCAITPPGSPGGVVQNEHLRWEHKGLVLNVAAHSALNLRINVPGHARVSWTFSATSIIEYGFGWVPGDRMYQMNALETGNLKLNNPPTEPVHQCFDNTTTTTGVLVLTFDNTAATGYFATAREVKLDLHSNKPLSWQHYGERQVARSSVNGKAVFAIGVPVVIGAAVAGPAVAGWMAARGAAMQAAAQVSWLTHAEQFCGLSVI